MLASLGPSIFLSLSRCAGSLSLQCSVEWGSRVGETIKRWLLVHRGACVTVAVVQRLFPSLPSFFLYFLFAFSLTLFEEQ
jgi:hypothetical protein